jgi:hypothetical protein
MRLALASFLLLSLSGLLATSSGSPRVPELEVLPQHFVLHSGEQIHYTVLERPKGGSQLQTPCRILVGFGCPDVKFAIEDPKIVRLIDPKGLFEAVRPGRTQLVVRAPTSERRITVEVVGPAQPPMMAVPHSTVREIAAKDLLFVGHANRDGFDHTAVAKPGIDRLVQEAKKNGWTVNPESFRSVAHERPRRISFLLGISVESVLNPVQPGNLWHIIRSHRSIFGEVV